MIYIVLYLSLIHNYLYTEDIDLRFSKYYDANVSAFPKNVSSLLNICKYLSGLEVSTTLYRVTRKEDISSNDRGILSIGLIFTNASD